MFLIDPRIDCSCFMLGDWPLSRVFLKNEACYPWLILVPRQADVHEIHQLTKDDRTLLMEEINQLSLLVNHVFKPAKLNVGALGNVVPQLHVHVIGRTIDDALWPQGIWQSALEPTPYSEQFLNQRLPELKHLVHSVVSQII